VAEEAKAFTSAISETVTSFSESIDLRGRVQRAPIAMVGAALGIGYLLGGGLFSATTRRLLKAGIGVGLMPFVTRQLRAMAGTASTGAAGDRPAAPPAF
jgi:hypothetical protein